MNKQSLPGQVLRCVSEMVTGAGQLMDPSERWADTAFLAVRNDSGGLCFETVPLFFLDRKTTKASLEDLLPAAVRRFRAKVVVIAFSQYEIKERVEILYLLSLDPDGIESMKARIDRSSGAPQIRRWQSSVTPLPVPFTGPVMAALKETTVS